MRKLLRWVPVLGVGLLFLLLRGSVQADMRPPLPPGGGNLSTEADTWVQLIFETVLLDVREEMAYDYYLDEDSLQYVARVTADFDLMNLGQETEEMLALFPMTSIDPGASYPDPVSDFSVAVDGEPTAWELVESDQCPYVLYDQTCAWAQFPVTFVPDEMVHVTISYRSYLGELGGGLGFRYATYILTTGAAWHGPIWEADIILQLPFEANAHTVLGLDYYAWDVDVPEQPPEFEGNQARWNYHSFEPDRNWGIYFPDPALWVRVEEIKAALEEDEENAALWAALGSIYWKMCTVKDEYYDETFDWLGNGALVAYTNANELEAENPVYHGGFGDVLFGVGSTELYTLGSTDMLQQAIVHYGWALEFSDPEDYEHRDHWTYMAMEAQNLIDNYLAEQTTATPAVTETAPQTASVTAECVPTATESPQEESVAPEPTVLPEEPTEDTLDHAVPVLLITALGIFALAAAVVLVVIGLHRRR